MNKTTWVRIAYIRIFFSSIIRYESFTQPVKLNLPMTETEIKEFVLNAATEQSLEDNTLEGLASQLLWRIGRIVDDGPVVVRIGYATNAKRFAEMPRLKSVTDMELEEAMVERSFHVEWVGR